MKPKLLRASVLGFLVGGLIICAYFRYVDPVVEMQNLLKESNRDKEKIIDLEEMVRRKDDSLDVFKLDLAEQQAYDKQTWTDTLEIPKDFVEFFIAKPILDSFQCYIPDTLDSLEGECDRCRQHGKLFNFREWLFCEDCLKKAKNNKEQNVPDRVQPNEEGE